jgi:hypothetical protein
VANAAGVLTGDIFDRTAFEYFDNLGPNENSVLLTINGILTTPADAQALLNSVQSFNVGNRRKAVENGTHGILGGQDIVEIVLNELSVETIADLRAATQIELAAWALRNNGGQGEKTIYVVAHSQGTEVFFRALNFLRPETRAMIRFYGFGGQRFVPNDIGLRSAFNYYYPDDLVPLLANATPLRRPYASLRTYTVYRIPVRPGGSGHNWTNNYSTLVQQGVDAWGELTLPADSRRINYGGNIFTPFGDLRLDLLGLLD